MRRIIIIVCLLLCAICARICKGEVDQSILNDIITNRIVASMSLSQAEGWLLKARQLSGASNGDLREALEAFIDTFHDSADRTWLSRNCVMGVMAYTKIPSTNRFEYLSRLALDGTNAVSRAAYTYYCLEAPTAERIILSERILDDDHIAMEMKSQVWLEWSSVMASRSQNDEYKQRVKQALLRRRLHERDGTRCEAILHKDHQREATNMRVPVSEVRARRIQLMREKIKNKRIQ